MMRLCRLLLLLAAASAAMAVSITVEHSLDGGKSFVEAGTLTVHGTRKGATAVLERSLLSAEQRDQLAQLLSADGLYRLRLPSAAAPGAPPVATSFPARCLAAAAAPGGLEVDLLAMGSSGSTHVAGIAVNAPCRRGGAAASQAGELPQLPDVQDLRVRLPAAAPDVLPLVLPPGQGQAGAAGFGVPLDGGASGGGGGAASQGPGQQQAGAQQGGAQQGGKAGAAAGKKGAEEEKTWLQKNWMLVAPLGMILINILGNGMGAGQQQQQRPGGGAPVRAVPSRR